VSSQPGPELTMLIGEDALVRLAEAFGGTRLYVPATMKPEHDIVRAIGPDAAQRLAARVAPDVIRVPLAKDLRARHYRAQGRSNAQIATALGMSETGVEKMFRRMPDAPAKGSNQLDLFG
jgi:DNA-binding transcriptional regulator LsrR (DeoR family)